MEDHMILKQHTNCNEHSTSSTSSTKLTTHKDSTTICKSTFKPKIRIIHLFAPQVIETEPANFRDLVQKLTGKQSKIKTGCKKKSTINSSKKSLETSNFSQSRIENIEPENDRETSRSCVENGEERMKEELEEEIWGSRESKSSCGGFYSGFSSSEFDGFAELTEFPSLPLRSSHEDVFEDIKFSY